MDLISDVLFADGQENMGGLTKRAYIGFASSFTSIAKPSPNPTTYAERVTISENHVLAVGKKVIQVDIMYDKSGVDSPSVGTRKGMSSKPKITLVQAGNQASCVGLLDLLKNADVLIFAEPQDETVDYLIQIGTEALPASMTSHNITTGNSPEAERNITMVFEAPSRAGYYFYTGDLPRLGVAP